jgi:hypothetical protein
MPVIVDSPDRDAVLLGEANLRLAYRILEQHLHGIEAIPKRALVRDDQILPVRQRSLQDIQSGLKGGRDAVDRDIGIAEVEFISPSSSTGDPTGIGAGPPFHREIGEDRLHPAREVRYTGVLRGAVANGEHGDFAAGGDHI